MENTVMSNNAQQPKQEQQQQEKTQTALKDIVIEMDIPFIDIHKEVFEKEQNPLKFFPFELAGHYNIEGYKKIAETIYKFTKD